jgi:hypothetical protein
VAFAHGHDGAAVVEIAQQPVDMWHHAEGRRAADHDQGVETVKVDLG